MVKDITEKDRQAGYAWILDAKKLHEEWFKNQSNAQYPSKTKVILLKNPFYYDANAKKIF